MRKLLVILRYNVPLWLIGFLTNWMGDNALTVTLRGVMARPFLGQCGRRFKYGARVRFLHPEGIHLGRDVYIAAGCWISGSGGLTIEDEVMFGPNCIVVTASHSFKNGSARFGGARYAPVAIGRGSWLAAHVVVSAGVRIGCGNLVAANAVVTKDTEDNVMVGGVPAKVIGPREDDSGETPGR